MPATPRDEIRSADVAHRPCHRWAEPGGAVLSMAQDLETLESEHDVVVRFERFAATGGFTSTAYVLLPEDGGISLDDVVVNTRPQVWMAEYLAAEHQAVDPVLVEAMSASNPFSWSDLGSRRQLDDREANVMRHAARHGMTDGFVVPISNAQRNYSLVSLAGDGCDLSAPARAALTMGALYFHNRMSSLRAGQDAQVAQQTPMLTAREMEIVRWIAAGKSDWEIGRILELSAKTVNYHVERVKTKLGVATRTQAVVKALRRSGIAQ